MRILRLALVASFLVVAACGDDTGTENVTFTQVQESILTPSCAIPSCHDSGSAEGDLNLTAGAAYDQLVNQPTENSTTTLARVSPGAPQDSFLYRKLANDLEAGWGDPMPAGTTGLPADQLQLVSDWITNGAAND